MEFYATIDSDSVRSFMPDVPVMLPASSWARKGLRAPRLPAHVKEVAADCGGFVATFRWGDYKYTPAEYVKWLYTFRPSWAATMDYCCEDEITSGKPGIVRERQRRSSEMAGQLWWMNRGAPWAWVPTIQGWHIEDYQRHARELRPLIEEMADYYGPGGAFRVGIGTLCRRASAAMVRDVTEAVAGELPNIPLHLWGVKLQVLQGDVCLPAAVRSVDSAAWSRLFFEGRKLCRESGLTQRRYIYSVALPRYLGKVETALAKPKQDVLPWSA